MEARSTGTRGEEIAHYDPTIEAFRELAKGPGNLVPVYREVVADLETPVSAYLKIAREPNSFLLESVEGGERLARYSFMGTEPYKVFSHSPTPSEGWAGNYFGHQNQNPVTLFSHFLFFSPNPDP